MGFFLDFITVFAIAGFMYVGVQVVNHGWGWVWDRFIDFWKALIKEVANLFKFWNWF